MHGRTFISKSLLFPFGLRDVKKISDETIHTLDDIGIYFSTGPRLSVIDRSHR